MISYMYMYDYDEAVDRKLPGEKRNAKRAVDAPREAAKALENLKLAVDAPRENGNAHKKNLRDKVPAAFPDSTESEPTNSDEENHVDQLACNNVGVYVVADKYGIKPLKDLALKRFKFRLENHALNDALPELIRETMLLLPPHDDDLFETLVTFLIENTPVLSFEGMHSMLEDNGTLAAEVLKGVLKERGELEKTNKRLTVANRDLRIHTEVMRRNAVAIHANFREAKAELINKVNSLTSCRRCHAGFNIDLSEYSWESNGKIRCARCHTRH